MAIHSGCDPDNMLRLRQLAIGNWHIPANHQDGDGWPGIGTGIRYRSQASGLLPGAIARSRLQPEKILHLLVVLFGFLVLPG